MDSVKIIDGKKLYENINFCKERCSRPIMAMVKADAYGHGAKSIVKLLKDKCEWFGVVNYKEAKLVRKIAESAKILNVGKDKKYKLLIENNIDISVDNIVELRGIESVCSKFILCARVHIEVNTGMNRYGVKSINEFVKMLKFIKHSNYIKLIGLFTHFYDEDEAINHFDEQMCEFEKYVKLAPKDVIIHIGGSFCLNHNLPNYIDMVRAGFFIYGYGDKCVKPVMAVQSKIVKIIECKKGENVGYGKNVLCKPKKIAIVPIGYADGMPRKLSNIGHVYVGKNRCKIIGKICMDCLMIDVSGLSVKMGDLVEVFKNANDFARWAKTSPYEILTNFSKARTKRLII